MDPVHSHLINDCADKLKLFLGHRIRVMNQRNRLQQIHQGMTDTDMLVFMDYKMNYEPMYFREKTLEHYGEKGVSWHGSMIYAPQSSGEMGICYYNHISSGDSKQDWMSTLSIFEGILIQLQKDFPSRTKLYVQYDNAKCYQNGRLLMGILLVCKKCNITLKTFVHTETQYGKGSIDGHFEVGMRLVNLYVNMGFDVVSSKDLFEALQSSGGLKNAVVFLSTISRPAVQHMYDLHSNAFNVFARLNRFNEACVE